MRVVCASANPHKVAEISELICGVVELLPRPAGLADVVEDADTLTGNARLKAVAICRATDMPALADDTGLEVDALSGRPGVLTARFAGPGATDAQNRAMMLQELRGVTNRSARFRTVALLRMPNGQEIFCEGVCEGLICINERGERGFGYDSLFVPDAGDGRTFAEMSIGEKHALSHRGVAFRKLATRLGELPAT
ncbi:MAG: RdgB/HAM1 family non-canonical purine NTP pyrophosphatase [Actinobacteria bacterium]|nr:RdgB/HAM1 family non-canonical purine NTP pyrophosphatase [Actinomycetota bacterium]